MTTHGITRVESNGSIWELDDALQRYRRFPKHEAPRERPDWSDDRAGALQDFVWHPMLWWKFRAVKDVDTLAVALGMPWDDCLIEAYRLIIATSENENGVILVFTAPMPHDFTPDAEEGPEP